jgi:hypothetical protein
MLSLGFLLCARPSDGRTNDTSAFDGYWRPISNTSISITGNISIENGFGINYSVTLFSVEGRSMQTLLNRNKLCNKPVNWAIFWIDKGGNSLNMALSDAPNPQNKADVICGTFRYERASPAS